MELRFARQHFVEFLPLSGEFVANNLAAVFERLAVLGPLIASFPLPHVTYIELVLQNLQALMHLFILFFHFLPLLIGKIVDALGHLALSIILLLR